MRIITQQGKETDMTAFNIRHGFSNGSEKWAVTGKLSSDPFMVKPDYTIGTYGDKITAFVVLSQIVQHEGAEPYKLPPEDTVLDL